MATDPDSLVVSLSPGGRFGPYVLEGRLGAGGMGEVLRARDTRLGRTVAIKVLSAHLAANPESRQRFEVEARAIASLNHPHICALYDIGEQDGVAYMVMEYLEGETLAARLKRGSLPLAEALRHAIHAASALEQAHRRGVVHRDIKPGNMMLTKAGIKLLDFGLARLRERVTPEDATISMTQEGSILGTPQYMAPEQVEGKETDARTDLFAFGSVLYEMASGKKAFAGDSQQAVMSSILHGDLPPAIESVPPALNRALRICWTKDPDERWQSAGDLRRELEWIAKGPEASIARAGRIGRREVLAWSTAAVFGAAGTAAAVRALRPGAPQPSPVHFTILEPPGLSMNFFQSTPAVSPDGRMIAFAAQGATRQSLWIRSFDTLDFRELADTDSGQSAFWSSDSRSLAFFADGKLKRVQIGGGPAQVICDSTPAYPGAWNRDGVIVFSKGRSSALYRVPAEGGTPEPLTSLEPFGHSAHTFPFFLPGEETLIFLATGTRPESQGLYTVSLASKQVARLSPVVGNAGYMPPGFLFLWLEGKLMAQRFDAAHLRLEGDPFPAGGEGVFSFLGMGGFQVSSAGVLSYAEEARINGQLMWLDRSGKRLSAASPPAPYIDLDVSKDGRRVLLERLEGGRGDLWVLDLARGVPSRLTSGPGWSYQGRWSPDGARLVYSGSFEGGQAILLRDAAGGPARRLMEVGFAGPGAPTDWSPDSRYLISTHYDPKTGADLWLLPTSADSKPVPYLVTPSQEGQARVSPDGRWMAYVSNESGSAEVYVDSFPEASAKYRISTKGGLEPTWRADGKELFYLTPDQTLMAVPMRGAPDQAGTPEPLFQTPMVQYSPGNRSCYAPSSDGKRFLVNTKLEAGPHAIHVITGWTPGIR